MGLDLVAQEGAGQLERTPWWSGLMVVRPSQPSSWWCDDDLGAEPHGVVLPSPDPPVERGGRLVGGSWWSALRGEAGEPPLIQIRGESERETRVLRGRQREAVDGVGRELVR